MIVAASHRGVLFGFFMACCSDALFVTTAAEYERVKAHLVALGKTPEEIKRVSRAYYRRMCMKEIPEPLVLVQRFYDVYVFFQDMDDPERPGHRFYVDDSWDIFVKEMKYVQVRMFQLCTGVSQSVSQSVNQSVSVICSISTIHPYPTQHPPFRRGISPILDTSSYIERLAHANGQDLFTIATYVHHRHSKAPIRAKEPPWIRVLRYS